MLRCIRGKAAALSSSCQQAASVHQLHVVQDEGVAKRGDTRLRMHTQSKPAKALSLLKSQRLISHIQRSRIRESHTQFGSWGDATSRAYSAYPTLEIIVYGAPVRVGELLPFSMRPRLLHTEGEIKLHDVLIVLNSL